MSQRRPPRTRFARQGVRETQIQAARHHELFVSAIHAPPCGRPYRPAAADAHRSFVSSDLRTFDVTVGAAQRTWTMLEDLTEPNLKF